jgi:protein disulfide-isomerase
MTKLGIGLVAAIALARAALAAEETWLTDFAKAQEQAKQEKKLIFMDFTGSDWCPPCKALHKNVLTSKEFNEYAKDKFVLVLIDFPNSKPQSAEEKKANNTLAQKFKVVAFPTIVLLDSNGNKLDSLVGYVGESPKEFIAKVEKLKPQPTSGKNGS